MDPIRVMDVKESILQDNDERAEAVRRELREKKVFLLNLMGSPGAGKTTTLVSTIRALRDEFRIGVMEADVDSDVDARAVQEAGAEAIQLHTGGMCHLDAEMTREGLSGLVPDGFDLIVIENVGNLVCPAEFDTGCSRNAVLLSVPEGDDKPRKYPLMFEKADVVLITKTDAAPAFDFDMERAEEWIRRRNERCRIIPVSAKTGTGMDEWCAYLSGEVDRWQSG